VALPVRIGVEQLTPSISVGISAGGQRADVDGLIAEADSALIRIKRARRGPSTERV